MGFENVEEQPQPAPQEAGPQPRNVTVEEKTIPEESVEGKESAERSAEKAAEDGKKKEGEKKEKTPEEEAEEAAKIEAEIARGQESLEGQIESIQRSNQRWLSSMNMLEAAAKGAGKRYQGLSSAEGIIASRKKQVEQRLGSLSQNLQRQKIDLFYKSQEGPEKAIEAQEQQERLLDETGPEVGLLTRATAALEEGEERMRKDFSGTFELQFMQFENIVEGKPFEESGNAEAIMKRLHHFMDEENPMEGGAGAVSAALNAYREKASRIPMPNEAAKQRMEQVFEETKEQKPQQRNEGEKFEEEHFFGVGEAGKEEHKENQQEASPEARKAA